MQVSSGKLKLNAHFHVNENETMVTMAGDTEAQIERRTNNKKNQNVRREREKNNRQKRKVPLRDIHNNNRQMRQTQERQNEYIIN